MPYVVLRENLDHKECKDLRDLPGPKDHKACRVLQENKDHKVKLESRDPLQY